MAKKVRCEWCLQVKAKPKKIFLNKDGSKNLSDPYIYTCFFLGLGITIVTSVPEQWQALVAWLILAAGAAVVARLVLYRRTLPRGIEYRCSSCGYRWYTDAPVEEKNFAETKME